jgi:hypothetical protein
MMAGLLLLPRNPQELICACDPSTFRNMMETDDRDPYP